MSQNKVKKYRKPLNLNLGVIVFVIILIYILSRFITYVMKENISVTEVQKGTIISDGSYTGIIIRDEEIIYAGGSGYVNYFINNGDKVAKGGSVYLLSERQNVMNSSDSDGVAFTAEDYADIKNIVSTYSGSYSDSTYSEVYSFKYEIQNKITEAVSRQTIGLAQVAAAGGSYNTVTASRSGLVSYTYDGMEDLTVDDITEDLFSYTDYSKHQMTSNERISSGSPAYKLTQGDDWSIVIKLNEHQAKNLENSSTVTVKFSKDSITTTAQLEIFEKNGHTYARLDLSKYMVRYLSERYIDIEIITSTADGLKIPTTAVVTKDFYKIPIEYLITDESTDEKAFLVSKLGDNGELVFEQVQATVYSNDGEYCYVDMNEFALGDYIGKLNSDEEDYRIGSTGSLTGVYNINQGYAVFRLVQILYQDDEYCIVRANTAYGIAIYDYIVLNGNSVTEDQLIY